MPFLFLQAGSLHSYKMKIDEQPSCNLPSFLVQPSDLFEKVAPMEAGTSTPPISPCHGPFCPFPIQGLYIIVSE